MPPEAKGVHIIDTEAPPEKPSWVSPSSLFRFSVVAHERLFLSAIYFSRVSFSFSEKSVPPNFRPHVFPLGREIRLLHMGRGNCRMCEGRGKTKPVVPKKFKGELSPTCRALVKWTLGDSSVDRKNVLILEKVNPGPSVESPTQCNLRNWIGRNPSVQFSLGTMYGPTH